MNEVEKEARLIASQLTGQDVCQMTASQVFLDLYEMAKDLLLNDKLPLQRAA